METVDKFFISRILAVYPCRSINREELVSINKEAIRFLINDIKLYKDMATGSRVRVGVVE
jgi:hypothetical protein